MLLHVSDARERIHEAADRVALEAARNSVTPAQTYIDTYRTILDFFLEKETE